jgi:hypothetical protein
MSKIKRLPIQESDEPIEYEKLRLDVLKSLVDGRNIECKQTKDEMIKHLKLDDEGKYIRPVTYQKQSDETFIVGIAINDGKNLFEMGKLVEKNIAKSMGLYCNDRIHYISKQKLL